MALDMSIVRIYEEDDNWEFTDKTIFEKVQRALQIRMFEKDYPVKELENAERYLDKIEKQVAKEISDKLGAQVRITALDGYDVIGEYDYA